MAADVSAPMQESTDETPRTDTESEDVTSPAVKYRILKTTALITDFLMIVSHRSVMKYLPRSSKCCNLYGVIDFLLQPVTTVIATDIRSGSSM